MRTTERGETTRDFDAADNARGWTALNLASLVLRRRGTIVACTVLGFLLAVVPPLVKPRSFTSPASFMLSTRRGNANIGGLAAQLGLSMLSADAGQSPQLYADLLKSTELLGAAVDARYPAVPGGGAAGGSLLDALKVKAPTAPLRRDAGIRELGKRTSVSVSPKTQVVSVSVRMEDPVLAAQVCDRLLALLSDFNQRTRQSQASAERSFTERRLLEAQRDLRTAELRLQSFLEQNREYQIAPRLTFEYDRLSRDVSIKQQLYSLLAQSYEQARMEEVRDTPLLTILQPARPPVRPDTRGLIGKGLLGLMVGSALGVGVAILREYQRRMSRLDASGYEEFAVAWRDVTRSLPRPWRSAAPKERV